MPIVRRGQQLTPYYYRFVYTNGKRRLAYVGKAADPKVQLVMRNDRLLAAEEKMGEETRKAQQKRCREFKVVWAHLMQILVTWKVLTLANAGRSTKSPAEPTSPSAQASLLVPYPWQGNWPKRFRKIRFLISERVVTSSQVDQQIDQIVQAGEEDVDAAIGDFTGTVAYQRKVFAAAVDLLAICRDLLFESIAKDCPITRAAIEAAMTQRNLDNGFAAASPMERLLIESLTVTYFESMAFSALSFENDHGSTHAKKLSDTANQAARRFVVLWELLDGYRKHHAGLLEEEPLPPDASAAG
jgi:hypothetical protein